jgi:putative acetyltransferase
MMTDVLISATAHLQQTKAIRRVHQLAFGREDEADLVERLNEEGVVLLSTIAIVNGKIVGHILFSRMWIDMMEGSIDAVALAPLAVVPEFQWQGIGSRLIGHGLDELRRSGERIVIVLGHPSYYPRFGFSTDKATHLISPFPRHVYMALELVSDALDGVHGRVRYPAAFQL